MLKDITLGQYFPGDTVAHRLDARTKILLVLLYIVGLFQAEGWLGYITVAAVTAGCMALSHIKPANIFKGLKPALYHRADGASERVLHDGNARSARMDNHMGGH